jgi:predicted outer membrane protein
MKFLKLALKNKEKDPASFDELYENMIIRKIRERYTVNQELAILRQRDAKPHEFAEYNAFVERCKAEVKKELGI